MFVRWQLQSPTPGSWWVSLAPEKRSQGIDPVWPVEVDAHGTVWAADAGIDGGSICEVSDERFMDAQWAKRTTPADPFEVPPIDLAALQQEAKREEKRRKFWAQDPCPDERCGRSGGEHSLECVNPNKAGRSY